MALHKLAEERFARPVGIEVSGIDEIAPGLAESIVYLSHLVLGRTPTPVIAKGHRAERCLRNSKSAVAQKSVFHMNLLFSLRSNESSRCPSPIRLQIAMRNYERIEFLRGVARLLPS